MRDQFISNRKRRFIIRINFFTFLFFLWSFFFCFVFKASQADAHAVNNYPRIANHYLKWGINSKEATELAKWDLLILDMEDQGVSSDKLKQIKKINPDILMLCYINPQEIVPTLEYPQFAILRSKLLYEINKNNWWLKDQQNNKVSFWPGSHIINLTDAGGQYLWNNYLPYFVQTEILKYDHWDGIFYDNLISGFPAISSKVDLDKNGEADQKNKLDELWRQGVIKIIKKTREENKQSVIVGNSASWNGYQTYINGRTFESFPTPWEGNGSWEASMRPYLVDLTKSNAYPQIYTINSNTDNKGDYANYQKMRFGLTSTLLGNGYFSFDHGDTSHAQLWWYDEYDVNLGEAKSDFYNMLDKNNNNIKPSLWRRDFEHGITLVNSTSEEKTFVFKKEQFEKISGTQDRRVNNGILVNYVKVPAKDGIILLKRNTEIIDNSFNNGSFVRVFDDNGRQVQNGFFSYVDNYTGNTQILVTNLDGLGGNETLVNGGGMIRVYQNGKKIKEFEPYNMKFRGEISMAVSDLNGDGTKEIITGAGAGGGPQVRIFSKDGKALTGGFFAYNSNFRGGVNIAVLDLNNDGTKEIVTGTGAGGGPQVRIFSKDGKALTGGFFAFDNSFKGGVSVATGNIDGKGDKEIIVGAGAGNKPMIRIFSKDGKFIKQFLAYDDNLLTGIKAMSYDINNDGVDEILAGTTSF